MFDCTTDNYNCLYEPWLAYAGELLYLAGYRPGERLLDLCGGTGAVTHEAWLLGGGHSSSPKIVLFDLNPRYENTEAIQNSDVQLVQGRAENLLCHFVPKTFDVVVCRQAIGYVDLRRVATNVAMLLPPGGRFTFNAFLKPKPFRVKTYKYLGERYVEGYCFDGKHVTHVQGRPGAGWDLTRFRYYSEAEFHEALEPWFNVTMQQVGRGLHYCCIRKES